MTASSPSARSSARRLVFRLLAATVVPATLLMALEGTLRLAGVGDPTGFLIPTKRDGQSVLIDNDAFSWRFFPRHLERSSGPFALVTPKPERHQRVVLLGGSAARGSPEHTFGVARVLQVLLEDESPNGVEVINAAMTAINSHVVRDILVDSLAVQPDALVIYLGNNEVVGPFGAGTVFTEQVPSLSTIRRRLWLKTTRLGQLFEQWLTKPTGSSSGWEGMKMFLDQQVPADHPAMETVYAHFEANLRAMTEQAQDAGVPVLLCTVATNLRDCPPFASRHDSTLSPDQLAEAKEHRERAAEFKTRGEFDQALAAYEAAVDIDRAHAETWYRLAQLQSQLGKNSEARVAYETARDEDTLRFRADRRINEVIRTVAASSPGVELVDAEQAFQNAAPQGIPGVEHFWEHVHLTFEGNELLAQTILPQLLAALDGSSSGLHQSSTPATGTTEEDCAQALGYNSWSRYRLTEKVYRSILRDAPFTLQIDQEERLAEGERQLAQLKASGAETVRATEESFLRAIQKRPRDPWLHYHYSEFLRSVKRDFEGCLEHLQVLQTAFPDYALAHSKAGLAFDKLDRHEDAIACFERALEIDPDSADDWSYLGQTYGRAGDNDRAVEFYQRALEHNPAHGGVLNNLGLAYGNLGHSDLAVDSFRRAIEAAPDLWDAHFNLGRQFAESDQPDAAIETIRNLTKQRPDLAGAHAELGQLLASQNRYKAAAKSFREASLREPNNTSYQYNLGAALAMSAQATEAQAVLEQLGSRDQERAERLQNLLKQIQEAQAPKD